MISVSLDLSCGTVVVSTSGVVGVVVGDEVAGAVGGVVVVVVVNSAAGRVEEAAEVEGDAGGLVVATGASVLGTEGSALTGRDRSPRSEESLTVFSRLSAEEPHAATPIAIHTKSTAIFGVLGRLTFGSATTVATTGQGGRGTVR